MIIPSEIDGHPVRRLAANSFSQNSYIEEVTIPDSVEVIGSQAFMMCKSLQRVYIGKNVRKIDNDAFICAGNWKNKWRRVIKNVRITYISVL